MQPAAQHDRAAFPAAPDDRRSALPRSTLSNIQALRAVAASLVLVHHACVYLDVTRGLSISTRLDGLFGMAGVAIFFAISGFLMSRLIRENDPWTFLAHRVARIFPAFLAVTLLFAALYGALRLPFSLQPLALTLAPVGPRSYPLNVEWTLVYETSFYVGLFLLAIVGGARRVEAVAAAWLAVLALAWLLLPGSVRGLTIGPPWLLPLMAPNVAFAAGLLLPRLLAAGLIRPALGLLVPPLAVAAYVVEQESARWLIGIASVIGVGLAVARPQIGTGGGIGRALVAYGDWSYVLYLAHPPVVLLVTRYLPASVPPAAVWIAAFAAPLAVAALLGPLDVRAYRRLRRVLDAWPRRRLAMLGLAYLGMFFGASLYGTAEVGLETWRRSRVEAALAVLPAGSTRTRAAAEAAIAATGRALPAGMRGEADDLAPAFSDNLVLGGWAVDLAKPGGIVHLAVFCGGRAVVIGRGSRLRADVATRLGLARPPGRIGFRLLVPRGECRGPDGIVAIIVDDEGRMGLLPGLDRLEAAAPRP